MGLMYGSVSISQYLPQFLPLINAVFHFRGECLLPVVFSDIFYGISYSIADCFRPWVGSSWIGLFLYLIYACFICTANALKSFAKHGFTFFCPIYIYSSYTSGFYFTISYIWFYFFPMIRWCYLLVILGWIELFLWCRKRFPGWMPLYWISSQNAVSYFSIIVRLIVSNSEGFFNCNTDGEGVECRLTVEDMTSHLVYQSTCFWIFSTMCQDIRYVSFSMVNISVVLGDIKIKYDK